jgi:hypothetical protein
MMTAGVASAAAQAPGHAYVDDFGIEAPVIASGNSLIATYYGWEATTVFGHQIYAMTATEYATDLANGCFAFYSIYRSNCLGATNQDLAGLLGISLFGKTLGVSCPVPAQACFGNPFSVAFTWTPGTEIVFALAVNQGIDGVLGTTDYNWFFSGDPTRNAVADGQPTTGFAHLAYFAPTAQGIPGNRGIDFVPGTANASLFGFEDVGYGSSDWDFNNAIFALSPTPPGIPTEVVPEPATLLLFGSGVGGLVMLARRPRRRVVVDA